MKKHTVLCYTQNETGRDTEIVLPLRYFAETYLNCRFIHKTAYDVFALYRYKPDIVFIPNSIGNHFFAEIGHYAKQQNIKVFALYSEGDFRTDGTFDYWGVNQFKEYPQEYVCMWNQRTTDYLKSVEPEHAHKIVLTGGVGFDRYKIYDFMQKASFLKKYGKESYKRIIGYASWGVFGKLYHDQGIEFLQYLFRRDHYKEKVAWLEDQRKFVERSLRETIEKNPDILFVLKRHPTETHEHIKNRDVTNDILHLKDYPNVVYIRDEENIHDLINVTDIWLSFESTTCLEAWMLEKPTIYINNDIDFQRSQYYKGCAIAGDANELQSYIEQYYNTATIDAFEATDRKQQRQKIMEDVIGFMDGFNHIRAGFYFDKTLKKALLERKTKKRKFHLRYFAMYMAMTIGKYFYQRTVFQKIPKLNKTIWVFETYRQKQIERLYEHYHPFFGRFHKRHHIPQSVIKKEIGIRFLQKKR